MSLTEGVFNPLSCSVGWSLTTRTTRISLKDTEGVEDPFMNSEGHSEGLVTDVECPSNVGPYAICHVLVTWCHKHMAAAG